MWTWTCSACGKTFSDPDKATSERLFTEHARAVHNPASILSVIAQDESEKP